MIGRALENKELKENQAISLIKAFDKYKDKTGNIVIFDGSLKYSAFSDELRNYFGVENIIGGKKGII